MYVSLLMSLKNVHSLPLKTKHTKTPKDTTSMVFQFYRVLVTTVYFIFHKRVCV